MSQNRPPPSGMPEPSQIMSKPSPATPRILTFENRLRLPFMSMPSSAHCEIDVFVTVQSSVVTTRSSDIAMPSFPVRWILHSSTSTRVLSSISIPESAEFLMRHFENEMRSHPLMNSPRIFLWELIARALVTRA